MRKEFWFWIIHSIEDMAERLNHPLTLIQRNKLIKDIQQFSNEEYNNVSKSLTLVIEENLLLFGFNPNEAIRLSWKWSD